MKFTLSWLKDHLDTEADLARVVETMTLAGLEVEEVVDPGAKLAAFSVARIVTAAQHPNADRLRGVRKSSAVRRMRGPVW
jgi:phenylalanyl-tRNA synthetase beta chain